MTTLSMIQLGSFSSRQGVLLWAEDILRAEKKGQFEGNVGFGEKKFENFQAFFDWFTGLTDEEYRNLPDHWIKFGTPSSKQA